MTRQNIAGAIKLARFGWFRCVLCFPSLFDAHCFVGVDGFCWRAEECGFNWSFGWIKCVAILWTVLNLCAAFIEERVLN